MEMHTSTENSDISLAKKFQKHISDTSRAHGLIDNEKDRKLNSRSKWTERDYHVQEIKY